MKNRTVCFDSEKDEVRFFIDGLHWFDLDRIIPIDEALSTERMVCHQRIIEPYFIRPHIFHREKYMKAVSISKRECTHPHLLEGQTLRNIRQFLSDNKMTVTDFKIQMKSGLTISQPVYNDLLFTGGQANRTQIEAIIKKTGLQKKIIAALKSEPGKVISINEDGKSEPKREFGSLQDYIKQRYTKSINI